MESARVLIKKSFAPYLLGLLILSGSLCGSGCSYIEVVDHYGLSSEQLLAYRDLQIVDLEQRSQGSYRRIGVIRGLSCTRSATQVASEATARDQVRLRASLSGAHAISPPSCSHSSEIDWSNNCWAAIICESELLVDQARSPPAGPDATPSTPETNPD
jgi:hypothetical protein